MGLACEVQPSPQTKGGLVSLCLLGVAMLLYVSEVTIGSLLG